MSGSAPEAVASLLSIALSSDTRLRESLELSSGDSELALGESGSRWSLFTLVKLPREKSAFLEGLDRMAFPGKPLFGDRGPAVHDTSQSKADAIPQDRVTSQQHAKGKKKEDRENKRLHLLASSY